jgi:hypothetical protein
MTQAQTPTTDIEIRKAIASAVRQALLSIYSAEVANAVRIHDHWMLGFNLGENAALLRVLTGVEQGKIHGWLIGLSGVSRKRPDPIMSVPQGAHHLRKTNPNRRDILRTYRVWCYHELDTGTVGSESDNNSENRLAIETEAVSDYLSSVPQLGIENDWIMGHEDLQFNPIDVFAFGEAKANVAQGTLSVRLQKPYDLNQY